MYVGSYFLDNVSWNRRLEISQVRPVKCWNHVINNFECVGDFPSDVLQGGMHADGAHSLRIYGCSQGEEDCLGHTEVWFMLQQNSLSAEL